MLLDAPIGADFWAQTVDCVRVSRKSNSTNDQLQLYVVTTLRLRSHRHEYEYVSGFPFMAHRSFTRTSGAFTVTCTST